MRFSFVSLRLFLERVFFGRKLIRPLCQLEEGWGAAAEKPLLCPRVDGQNPRELVLPSHGIPERGTIGFACGYRRDEGAPANTWFLTACVSPTACRRSFEVRSGSRRVIAPIKDGKLVRKRERSTVSFWFVRDRKRWRVLASAEARTGFPGQRAPCRSGWH